MRYLFKCLFFKCLFVALVLNLISLSVVLSEELPKIRKAPVFELTDTAGESYSFTPEKKAVQVVNFFFSRCPSICPKINSALKKTYNAIPEGKEVLFHSITVDPEHDTSEILRLYAERYRKKSLGVKRWKFLTGDMSIISNLLSNGFSLGSGSLPDEHNTRVVLIDRDGFIRGFYQGMDEDHLLRLEDDLRKLL